MSKKTLILAFIFALTAGFVSYQTTYALFSSTSHSTNNVFATGTFPTATPTITLTPTSTNTPTPTATPTPTPIIAQTLVINEVLPHTNCFQGQTENQFVELWNGTSGDINLQDFKLSDGTNTIAISNASKILPTHAFAILVKDQGLIGNGKCNSDVHGAVTPNLGGPVDMNTGTLEILDSGHNVIDTVKWNGVTGLNPTINQSIERTPLGHDTATGTNFNASDFGTPGTPSPGIE